jgi:hypothetical protein
MCQTNVEQNKKEIESATNGEPLINILRILCMLEKALNRLARRNYYKRSQYPSVFFEIEDAINALRSWINNYKAFSSLATFNMLAGTCIREIGQMIEQLIVKCEPLPGKKEVKKSSLNHEQETLCQSIKGMLKHIEDYLEKSQVPESPMSMELEKALFKAFEAHYAHKHDRRVRVPLSTRGEKTYIFPYDNKEGYLPFINDKKKFKAEVVDKLGEYAHATGHKSSCRGKEKYHLIGFRSHLRKPITEGGKQEEFPIRMVQCVNCKEKFSLVPSFLPREKHFVIDIIGTVVRSIVLFGQSLLGAFESLKMNGKGVKSKQTILNWLRWVGALHPATILTRAGVQGSGYLQEDEGFEKEACLRTYAVVMVDPENLLVWHADYVDHVDEETLCGSFEKFVERIDFKVLGVTKDKWQASTNALKSVFHRLWIGFCHRHCLKKFRESLSEYQKETGCSSNEVKRLYKKFKNVLDTASSKVSLEVKLTFLTDQAFNHPLLRQSLDELKKNAVRYTCYKKRKGITKTTSIVDNYLKNVKRKLRQVESFRDQDCTGSLLQAMANIRNFVPFMSGAKNAHKSPFMLAQGQTYDLPWMQVMNMHNAFLFTANAF